MSFVDIVFDGPPGPEAGRFVEVEDAEGKSISMGEWINRGDGYWALRIPNIKGIVDNLMRFLAGSACERHKAIILKQTPSEFLSDNLGKCLQCLEERVESLQSAADQSNAEVCQILGKALGYPWYKDDQAHFPGATEVNGVCVGEHVATSIAEEAARKISELGGALLLARE